MDTTGALPLYATGYTSGCVLDSGDSVTHVVPVYKGYTFPSANGRMDFGGRDLTEYLAVLLSAWGHSFTSSSELEIVREIKEKLTYVALHEELKPSRNLGLGSTYVLPDGNTVAMESERFQCPEALFDPSLLGIRVDGVHECTHKAIAFCDRRFHRTLYSNIVLAGGNTKFPWFAERLMKEISALVSPDVRVGVVGYKGHAQRGSFLKRSSAWAGGSILASLSTFSDMCISRAEYEEHGPSIVHTQCC